MTELRDIYQDGAYLERNSGWHSADSPYKARIVAEAIARSNLQFAHCVDVGCGAGLVTEQLAERFPEARFTGIDPSPQAATFWAARARRDNLTYENRNAVEAGDPPDLVLALDVFEHIEDYFGFLRQLRGSGRTFIFNIPLDMCVMKILSPGIKYAREDVGHLHYFSPYTAVQALKDTGYTVTDQHLSAAFLKIPPRNLRQAAVLPLRLATLVFGKRFAAAMFGGMSLVVTATG